MPRPASEEVIREWQQRIDQQKASGLSIQRWCEENDVTDHSFYYWKKRLTTLSRDCFVEIKAADHHTLILECNGIQIRLEEDFDPSVLMRCLEVVKAC